jgi:hypothetical protein
MLILGVDPSELRFMNMNLNIEDSAGLYLGILRTVPRREVVSSIKGTEFKCTPHQPAQSFR